MLSSKFFCGHSHSSRLISGSFVDATDSFRLVDCCSQYLRVVSHVMILPDTDDKCETRQQYICHPRRSQQRFRRRTCSETAVAVTRSAASALESYGPEVLAQTSSIAFVICSKLAIGEESSLLEMALLCSLTNRSLHVEVQAKAVSRLEGTSTAFTVTRGN